MNDLVAVRLSKILKSGGARFRLCVPLITLIICIAFIVCTPAASQAATYTYDTNILANGYGVSYSISAQIIGFNRDHVITQMLNYSITTYGSSTKYYRINYVVPDDGSTWDVTGVMTVYEFRLADPELYWYSFEGSSAISFKETRTTSGSYTGPSIGKATTAANNAKTSADTASTRALNAYNSVYNSNGNTITAVRDASGTVLSEARQAKTNSQNASTNALNAYNTAQTVNTKIDSLSSAVTNIQNNMGTDNSPPVVNLTTVSGARATSGNSLKIVVGVSDNISNTFTYSLNDSTYQPLPANRIVTVPVNGFDSVPINVWVRDEVGNTGTGFITIRKL